MQSALSQAFSEPLLAAMPQLSEKPHQGVPSSNPALYLGHEVSKSTTALGLRAALHLERVRSRYTGKERDTESGNDYFGARYYTGALGRFTTPDWSAKVEPVPYAQMFDPQSLNLYAYVRNNPLTRVDVDGHCDGWVCEELVSSEGQKRLDELAQQNAQKDAQAKAKQHNPKPPTPMPTPNAAPPVAPLAGILPPAADGAVQAAKQAAKGFPKPTPSPIPRPVPGPDPVPPQVPPGEIPEIEPGASWAQRIGIAILNLVKGYGQNVDVVPAVCASCQVQPSAHDVYCGKNNPDCSAELLQEELLNPAGELNVPRRS